MIRAGRLACAWMVRHLPGHRIIAIQIGWETCREGQAALRRISGPAHAALPLRLSRLHHVHPCDLSTHTLAEAMRLIEQIERGHEDVFSHPMGVFARTRPPDLHAPPFIGPPMPLMTLHATIELYPEDPGLELQTRRDLKTLSLQFPPTPEGSTRLAVTTPLAPSPFSELRVAWEFNQGEIEAVIVKVMTGVFSREDAKAREFLHVLEDVLPALGPQIVTALAHGIVHIGFDVNAEGWRYPAPSAHEKMRQIREAERTLQGRNAPGIAGDLQETYDPDGLPALLAQCPLPGIDP